MQLDHREEALAQSSQSLVSKCTDGSSDTSIMFSSVSSSLLSAYLVVGYYRTITNFQIALNKIVSLTSLWYRTEQACISYSNENGPKTDHIKRELQRILGRDTA